MLIEGVFKDINDSDVLLKIYNPNISNSYSFVIGDDSDSDVFFAGDEPILVECENTDPLDAVVRHSCSINLVTKRYLGDLLFSNKTDSTVVNVFRDGHIVFAGFLEPNTWSQGYAYDYENVTLHCVDFLAAAYNQTLIDETTYEEMKANSGIKSFLDTIVSFGLNKASHNLSLFMSPATFTAPHYPEKPKIYYDGSKKLNSDYNIFAEIGVNDIVWLGEEQDDLMSNGDILETIIQYLGLRIEQIGYDFYIYDLNTIKNNTVWTFRDIENVDDLTKAVELEMAQVTVDSTFYADDSTELSTADVYNKVIVTCKQDPFDTIISSPLSSDDLYSPYNNRQLYCRELTAEGEGQGAYKAFKAMCLGQSTSFSDRYTQDTYLQVMRNDKWKFYRSGVDLYETYVDLYGGVYKDQWKLPQEMGKSRLYSGLFSIGKTEKSNPSDNSPKKPSMNDYLVISVCGNADPTESGMSPKDGDLAPQNGVNAMEIVYTNPVAGSFTPPEGTTNYFVFSGKFKLNPIIMQSGPLWSVDYTDHSHPKIDIANAATNTIGRTRRALNKPAIVPWWSIDGVTCPVSSNSDGAYYAQIYYDTEYPNDTPREHPSENFLSPPVDFGKPSDYSKDWLKYGQYPQYVIDGTNNPHNGNDSISHIPILECYLRVGDMVALRDFTDDGNGNVTSSFHWQNINELETYVDDDGTTRTISTFAIGYDPKGGDYIIGETHDFENTCFNELNLGDIEGLCIPITSSDVDVNGDIEFKILGPVNLTFDRLVKRHKTWFRHTTWTSTTIPILPYVSSIYIEDFEMKVCSDNGGNIISQDEGDIIYMSDEQTTYVKDKEFSFDILSGLTTEEAAAFNIAAAPCKNTVVDMSTKKALYEIIDITKDSADQRAKAEVHFVDDVYKEFNSPKLELETVFFTDNTPERFSNLNFTYFNGKTFYQVGRSLDLKNDTTHLYLKEI